MLVTPKRAVADLLINRRELTSFEVRESIRPAIEAGQAVLALDRFGMTSNNLTDALTGSAMGIGRGSSLPAIQSHVTSTSRALTASGPRSLSHGSGS